MIFKKGAIDWTMGKLLSLILMVILVVLIIYGFTSGGINPLLEKIGGKFDEVLIMLNIKDDFGGDPGDCRTLDLTDSRVRGGVEFLEAMSFLNGRSEDGYRLDLFGEDYFKSIDICRGETKCVLNASGGLWSEFSWSWDYGTEEVDYNDLTGSVWHYESYGFGGDPPYNMDYYKFNTGKNNVKDAQFYWELRNKTIKLVEDEAKGIFDELYGNLSVFYGNAYDGRMLSQLHWKWEYEGGVLDLESGDIYSYESPDDELMFAVGWHGKWDIYFYPKHGGNYLYPKLLASGKSTAEMLEFFEVEFNDNFYDDDLYYKTIDMEEYREILSWKSGKFLGTGASNKVPEIKFPKNPDNRILKVYPAYDSEHSDDEKDSHLDGSDDIEDLKEFIDKKREDSQQNVGNIVVVISDGEETIEYVVDSGATLESEGLRYFEDEEYRKEYKFKIKGTDKTGDYFIRYRFNEWEFSEDNLKWLWIKNQNILGVTLSPWLEIIKNLDSKNYIDGVNSIFNECVDGSNSCELQSDREGENDFQMKMVAAEGNHFIRYQGNDKYLVNNWNYAMDNSDWRESEGSRELMFTYDWWEIVKDLNDWDYNGGVDSIIEECLSLCGGSVVGDESPFYLLNIGHRLLDEKWAVEDQIFTVISSGSKFQNMRELLKDQSIDVFGDSYIVVDVVSGNPYPMILLDGPRGEFYMQLAWPLRGEINFRINQDEGSGLVPVGDADDYMLPEGEFLDGYMVTGIYELMDRNC